MIRPTQVNMNVPTWSRMFMKKFMSQQQGGMSNSDMGVTSGPPYVVSSPPPAGQYNGHFNHQLLKGNYVKFEVVYGCPMPWHQFLKRKKNSL